MEYKVKQYGCYEVTVEETCVKKVKVIAESEIEAVWSGLQLVQNGVFESYEKPTTYACKNVRLRKEGFE